ncbi:uncharacterized protein LOC134687072 [Mytilus trossulus]|uniref:uncharacterized protein LOC134687072 n=1 Tax=Mytilus trossulus TaxID=6551 RepID=UPI003005CD26
MSLQHMEKDVIEYQNNIANIKQHASGLQAFLGLKQIEHDIEEKDKIIQAIVNNKDFNHITLSWKINSGVQYVQSNLATFGKIVVESKSSDVTIARRKNVQAQIMVIASAPLSLDKIELKSNKIVSSRGNDITGCSLFSNGKMIFSSYKDKKVVVLRNDGSKPGKINSEFQTFDVEQIDESLIAITTGSEGGKIIFADLIEKKTKKIIDVGVPNDGMAVYGGWLYFSAGTNGLMRVNIIDGSIREVLYKPMCGSAYIAVFGNNLYFTNKSENTVTCSDLEGSVKWIFKDERNLSFPLGISSDHYGNVYVVGNKFANVVVISPDGKRSRTILTSAEGLDCPQVLHYNRENNQILVANRNGNAFLFDVMFQ